MVPSYEDKRLCPALKTTGLFEIITKMIINARPAKRSRLSFLMINIKFLLCLLLLQK